MRVYNEKDAYIPLIGVVSVTLGVLAAFISVMGILGNSWTIIAFYRSKKVQTQPTNYMAITKSVFIRPGILWLQFASADVPFFDADLAAQTAVVPSFSPFLLWQRWCFVVPMILISVNRLLQIVVPNSCRVVFQLKFVIIMILAVWLISLGVLFPSFLGIWGQLGFKPDQISGSIIDNDGYSPKKLIYLVGILPPLMSVMICNICIGVYVSAIRKNVKKRRPSASFFSGNFCRLCGMLHASTYCKDVWPGGMALRFCWYSNVDFRSNLPVYLLYYQPTL
ncbi:Protein trapped in endoderm-1 [Orchesella cincta]|uniref:Protein trapped in endoderm-1 n=1 Tax=Orchesella cincta TaxID=48709 RepID=A0A1D2M9T6_ORCCI|nr:Protein trapped in endoderm-1 [Orchesella cincta]